MLDEAHRLRNVYLAKNRMGAVLKVALADKPKVLLTATPLQNSLLELYGLVSLIDQQAFGDLNSFKERFGNLKADDAFTELKARLKPLCHRTLRRQVLGYIRFTQRHSMLQRFTPDSDELRLYGLVSEYLRRPNIEALPPGQRTLTTMVMRKLLASSSFAIAGALESLKSRLNKKLMRDSVLANPVEVLAEDIDGLDETADEWDDEDEAAPLSAESRQAIEQQIEELSDFQTLAQSITQNSKGRALLAALEKAFEQAAHNGAARKAIIFTESRRTQEYLLRLLTDAGYGGKLVLFNGSNTDPLSRGIYNNWAIRHKGSDKVTGTCQADMRSALVEEFKDRASILIATEAGAEGINLQFCSLIINYDLPWNPQRIEQRIGRCHRYGQKYDVVVVNFLNEGNEADERVLELLTTKFNLFEGVFGASDEVLGSIE